MIRVLEFTSHCKTHSEGCSSIGIVACARDDRSDNKILACQLDVICLFAICAVSALAVREGGGEDVLASAFWLDGRVLVGMATLGLKSEIHEDYVDWDHNKRRDMLTKLLKTYQQRIEDSRGRLELAAKIKKQRCEELSEALQQTVQVMLTVQAELAEVQAQERVHRHKVDREMEILKGIKDEMIHLGLTKETENECAQRRSSVDPLTIPILTGHLQKLSDHLEIYNSRWFELTPLSLNYFLTEKDSVKSDAKPRGGIMLGDIMKCELVLSPGKQEIRRKAHMPQTLVVRGRYQNYILAGKSYDISLRWVTAINKAIQSVDHADRKVPSSLSTLDITAAAGDEDEQELTLETEGPGSDVMAATFSSQEFADRLESANNSLQKAIADMLGCVSVREKLTERIQNLTIVIQAAYLPMPLLGQSGSEKENANRLNHVEVTPLSVEAATVHDLLARAKEHVDSSDPMEPSQRRAIVLECLDQLQLADSNKRKEWLGLEGWVIERARAESRYQDLQDRVNGFTTKGATPMKTSILSKNMIADFAKQGLLTPRETMLSQRLDTRKVDPGPLFEINLS